MRGVRGMANAKIKRIIWMLLIAVLLVAGAFRAWEWLQPWRLGQERFAPYVQR